MGLPLVTSRGLPRWRPEAATWPWLWSITPTGAEFALTGAEFTALYTERLTRYGTARIARSLERIAREHDTDRIVLLCHGQTSPDATAVLWPLGGLPPQAKTSPKSSRRRPGRLREQPLPGP